MTNLRQPNQNSKQEPTNFTFEQMLGDPRDFQHLKDCDMLVKALKNRDCCIDLDYLFGDPLEHAVMLSNVIQFSQREHFVREYETMVALDRMRVALFQAHADMLLRHMKENRVKPPVF